MMLEDTLTYNPPTALPFAALPAAEALLDALAVAPAGRTDV
jgi:hypothetical protein